MEQTLNQEGSINWNKMKLCWLKSSINREIGYYKEYVYDSSSFVFEKKQTLEKYVTDLEYTYPNQYDDIIQNYEDEYMMYAITYTKIISSQNFLGAYTLFESFLKSIQHIIAPTYFKRNSSPENYKDIIKETSKIDHSSIDYLWEIIKNHTELRNSIVHHNSNIIENPEINNIESQPKYKNIKLFIPDFITIEYTGDFHITNDLLITNFLNNTREYLTKLIDLLNDTYK